LQEQSSEEVFFKHDNNSCKSLFQSYYMTYNCPLGKLTTSNLAGSTKKQQVDKNSEKMKAMDARHLQICQKCCNH